MIEKMKVVHIVAAASEKTALLDRLRTLGIVHFAEKASADQRHLERFAQLSRMDMALQEYVGPGRETAPMSDKDFEPFYKELADCLERRKTLQEKKTAAGAAAEKLAEWGDFSPEELRELKDQGFPAFMTVKDGLFYVRAGAFREMDNAVQMERRLRRLGYGTLITRS